MGFKSLRVSDISGQELEDSEVVTVTIKSAGKVFDAHPDELKVLKAVSNVVELEYKYPSGQVSTVLVPKVELNKLIPEEKLAHLASNRGRRPGFSPNRNGSSLIRSSQ